LEAQKVKKKKKKLEAKKVKKKKKNLKLFDQNEQNPRFSIEQIT